MTAAAVALLIQGYLVAGLVFAIWFAARGAGILDPVARAGTPGFRVLLLPGATLLWPWLALLIIRQRSGTPLEGSDRLRAEADRR